MDIGAKLRKHLGQVIAIVGVCMVMGAWGVLGRQCFLLLRDGHWTPANLRSAWTWLGLTGPHIGWGVAQEIVDWFFSWPLTGALFLVGGVVIWAGITSIAAAEKSAEIERTPPLET